MPSITFSASRILLLDLMFTNSQMNTQTLINFLYVILLILNLWKFFHTTKFEDCLVINIYKLLYTLASKGEAE